MTLTAPGSAQADSNAGGPIPPCPARGLVCRNCGVTFGLIAEHACAECFGPLEVDYDPELMRAASITCSKVRPLTSTNGTPARCSSSSAPAGSAVRSRRAVCQKEPRGPTIVPSRSE